MEALQEDKLMQPRVHHPHSFDSTGTANLNYRHKHPGGMKAAAGMWALKSQIYKETAVTHGMWYLVQAVSVKVICDDRNVGTATTEHLMCSYVTGTTQVS